MSIEALRFLITGDGEAPDNAAEIWTKFAPLVVKSWRFDFPNSRPWGWWYFEHEADEIPEGESAILAELGHVDIGEPSGDTVDQFIERVGRYLKIIEFTPGSGIMSRVRI